MKYLDIPFWDRLVQDMNQVEATGTIWWVWICVRIVCLGEEYAELERQEQALEDAR